MKKSTKRVQAGGLWFDVMRSTEYIATDHDGEFHQFSSKPEINSTTGAWVRNSGYRIPLECADLEGANWTECCWYVGDQVGGEEAERREWMARGADSIVDALSLSGAFTFGDCLVVVATHAAKIRAGEFE